MTNSSKDPCPQLLSLAVHEFRAHMSIVGGYLRMLERDEDEPLSERHRKWVNDAERSCARMVAVQRRLPVASEESQRLSLVGSTPALTATSSGWPSPSTSAYCGGRIDGAGRSSGLALAWPVFGSRPNQ